MHKRVATALLLQLVSWTYAYQIEISESDDIRQVCSGMWSRSWLWGGRDPYIEVLFNAASIGSAALVVYEWQDARYLGIASDGTGIGDNTWDEERVFICTLTARRAHLCPESALGAFIVASSANHTGVASSIYTAAVHFTDDGTTMPVSTGPFRYNVSRTGYYCVGTVPLTTSNGNSESTNTSFVTAIESVSFNGVVDFENTFSGHLPAAEYPKIAFYLVLAVVYSLIGAVWGYMSWKNRTEILHIQRYLSGTIVVLIFEMFCLYGYWSYLNRSGGQAMARVLLVLVSVVNAARNSLSLFLLCIVCMGFGTVRPSLGSVMLRVRILALAHFIFGILYSIGTVTIPLEDAGYFLFFFVMPLALSLTAFMMWIMWSLQATIADLETRKQTYKKHIFVRLHRILLCTATLMIAFFIISSISFSSRLDEDYAPDTWRTRFFLLDGWLGLLYLSVFCAISYLWRPSPFNRRLAMSDEVAMDDEEADFDIATMDRDHLHEDRGRAEYDEEGSIALPRVGSGSRKVLADDEVVFDIGDAEDEEPLRKSGDSEGDAKALSDGRPPSYQHQVDEE